MEDPIRIDGSTLEGGGQVLRVSMACAVLLCRPIVVHSIRGGRPKPGLKAQHLKGVEMVSAVCGGQLRGNVLNSMEVSLTPSYIRAGEYRADTQTAGSVTLLLQAVLPCALYAEGNTHLTLLGGTNADMAPPVDYTDNVWRPVAARFGVNFDLQLVKRGFFPRGGGELRVTVHGLKAPLKPVKIVERGKVTAVGGVCYVTGLPEHLGDKAIAAAQAALRKGRLAPGVPVNITTDLAQNTLGKGFGILLWCRTDTGVILGSTGQATFGKRGGPGTPAEELGRVAAEQLMKEVDSGVCLDKDMQNQVIMLMGLAAGESSVMCGPLTLHTTTAIEVLHQTTEAKFSITELSSGLTRIDCVGIGLDVS